MERLIAFTEQENVPAQQVMGSNGFQQVGVLRPSILRDGQWRDRISYGILREDVKVETK